MRLERLFFVVLFAVVSVVVASACTKVNPNYCAEAGADLQYSCAELRDARAHETHDAGAEASEVADASDAGDTGDGADMAEAMPEAKPVCSMDMDCANMDAGTPACAMSDGGAKCVACTASKHCTDSKKPACDTMAQKCVECVGTGTECAGTPGKSVCNAAAQSCVECLDNTKCAGANPICDTTTKACRPCTADSECKDIGPGICVDWDGHCAAATEVLTLQAGAGCTPSPGFFCASQEASAALNQSAPILLIRGSTPVGMIAPPMAFAPKVLIVGQNHAVISAGAGDAADVHLTGANEYWVRDLSMNGGTVGVLAEIGVKLHLTRCLIVGNMRGGILTMNASFDITNTVLSMNRTGDSTGGIFWAGARFGDLPAGGSARFENNTVVGNLATGISCASTYAIGTSIVHDNTGADMIGCMQAAPCCGATDPDPMLDTTYHLMSGSPCIDRLTATTMTPATDIDGQSRPMAAGKLDCGADEFQ